MAEISIVWNLPKNEWVKGYATKVEEDGHSWGKEEGFPLFIILKIPGVAASRVSTYVKAVFNPVILKQIDRRSRFQILTDNIPPALKQKVKASGELTVKAGTYDGPYDVTWNQFRNYFYDHTRKLTVTDDL